MIKIEEILFENPKLTFKKGKIFTGSDYLRNSCVEACKYGHIATLPEIAQARIYAPFDSPIWQNTIVTATRGYTGFSPRGKPVRVFAHNIPFKSDDLFEARSMWDEDKDRDIEVEYDENKDFKFNIKIEQSEFHKMLKNEDGKKLKVLDRETDYDAYVNALFGGLYSAYLDKLDELKNLGKVREGEIYFNGDLKWISKSDGIQGQLLIFDYKSISTYGNFSDDICFFSLRNQSVNLEDLAVRELGRESGPDLYSAANTIVKYLGGGLNEHPNQRE